MTPFEEKVNAALNWRIAEIATLAKLVTLNDALNDALKKEQITVLKKHLIPNFYAYWEGFVKDVCRLYLEDVNELKLQYPQIHPALLTFAVDAVVTEYNKNSDFNKRTEKVGGIYGAIQSISLPTEISTTANLNFKVLTNICVKLNLGSLDAEKYEKNLDKLLNFRNRAAHGEFNCPVDKLPIDEMRVFVVELMASFAIHIIEAHNNTMYAKR
jgi:hypothetical protein